MSSFIEDHALVLFQGDSITDAGRNRETNDLGRGYALMAAAQFVAKYPRKNIAFMNKGVGGDRVRNLQARWQEDCLDLRPTWVSVLIGVNDTWRRFSENDPASLEDFERGYRDLLTQTRDRLNAKLLLIEPFLFANHPDYVKWIEDLKPRMSIVRELALDFEALFLPADTLFAQACKEADADHWSHDGVHLTPAGHALLANAWLDTITAR